MSTWLKDELRGDRTIQRAAAKSMADGLAEPRCSMSQKAINKS